LLGVVGSILPDIDVIGFHLGVPYGSFFGHRGFTHSLLFAAIVAGIVALIASWSSLRQLKSSLWWAYFFVSIASHGLLDAMTSGGLGVAFFSPFETSRYFLPWRPILVSPLSFTHFSAARALAVLQSEVLCIWLPSAGLALLSCAVWRRSSQV